MATFYADADNGSASYNGTAASNSDPSSAVGPWPDMTYFTEDTGLAAGDKLILRRGMTGHYGGTGNTGFMANGDFNNPIIVEADYDDVWDDFQTESGVTLNAVSTSVTLAASSNAAAGDWIYNSGDSDDPRKFAYELASVTPGTPPAGDTGTLYLPFKGTAGSSKTITIMPAAPVWGDDSSWAQKLQITEDDFWIMRGVEFRSSNARAIQIIDSTGWQFEDVVIEKLPHSGGVLGTQEGFKCGGGACDVVFRKCRWKSARYGLLATTGSGAGSFVARMFDCLLDGSSTATSAGLLLRESSDFHCVECEFKNHAEGDIAYAKLAGVVVPYYRGRVWLRNCKLNSTTEIDSHHLSPNSRIYSEDHDQDVQSTRFFSMLSSAEGTPVYQSVTYSGWLRTGGSNKSIKVTPSTNVSTAYDLSLLKLFELPFYATTDSKTYTVYFRGTATSDWTSGPTASELWIELEYRPASGQKSRVIKKSTGTINVTSSYAWHSLTVTAEPGQAGVVYLRCYYGKTKEDYKANTFFFDPIPEVS